MATADAASQRERRARECRHGRGAGVTRFFQAHRSSRRDRDGSRGGDTDAWDLDWTETGTATRGKWRGGDPRLRNAGALDRLIERCAKRDAKLFFSVQASSDCRRERAQLTLHLRFEKRVRLLDSETFE